jgi:hypothetical protein
MHVIHGSGLIAVERNCSRTILCLFCYDFTAVAPLNGAPLHWRYNVSSLDPVNADARMLSCLPQKSFIATSEMFCFGLPRIRQKFSVSFGILFFRHVHVRDPGLGVEFG